MIVKTDCETDGALHYSNPELDLCYNVWSPCLLAGSLHKLDAGVLVELLHGLQDDLCLRLVVASLQRIRNLARWHVTYIEAKDATLLTLQPGHWAACDLLAELSWSGPSNMSPWYNTSGLQ